MGRGRRATQCTPRRPGDMSSNKYPMHTVDRVSARAVIVQSGAHWAPKASVSQCIPHHLCRKRLPMLRLSQYLRYLDNGGKRRFSIVQPSGSLLKWIHSPRGPE